MQVRARPNPGYLHSHVAAKLHSSMVVFGGERQGEVLNDLWRYHFGKSWAAALRPTEARAKLRAVQQRIHYVYVPQHSVPLTVHSNTAIQRHANMVTLSDCPVRSP